VNTYLYVENSRQHTPLFIIVRLTADEYESYKDGFSLSVGEDIFSIDYGAFFEMNATDKDRAFTESFTKMSPMLTATDSHTFTYLAEINSSARDSSLHSKTMFFVSQVETQEEIFWELVTRMLEISVDCNCINLDHVSADFLEQLQLFLAFVEPIHDSNRKFCTNVCRDIARRKTRNYHNIRLLRSNREINA
jgi:hypothetical protein